MNDITNFFVVIWALVGLQGLHWSLVEACQKRGVAAPKWSINGGFVVVTFMRPAKGDTQNDTQGDTQNVTKDVTKDVTKQLSDR